MIDRLTVTERDLSLRAAQQRLAATIERVVDSERLPLDACLGRILAEPLIADRDIPSFDGSAMDGYAFAAQSLRPGKTTRLRLLDDRAAAGHPFEATVEPGQAIAILTGAPMPAGTDTVLILEQARITDGHLEVGASVRAGQNCRLKGEDMHAGQTILPAGQRLGPQHLGVAARLGHADLAVYRRLRVALASSGDELAEPGAPLPPGGVFDANRVMLKAALSDLPVELSDLGILPDDPTTIEAVLMDAAGRHDLLITSGGASRGDADHLVRLVRKNGSLHFWEVRMKPGRPLAMGQLGDATFIGLPGNPVASISAFALFARPTILAMAGAPWPELPFVACEAAFSLRRTRTGRSEILRARLVDGSGTKVTLLQKQGSHMLSSLVEAHGLLLLEEGQGNIEDGQNVLFARFSDLGIG